jgi:hypothetical protein
MRSSCVIEATSSRTAPPPRQAPSLLAAIGSAVVLAATFVPWYRTGTSHLPRTAWQENPVVLALLLAVVLAGAATALAFGGYPALLGINLVKASAVVTLAAARRGRQRPEPSGERRL